MTEQDQQNAASDNSWKQKKNWTATFLLAVVGLTSLYAVIINSNFRGFSALSSVHLRNNLVRSGAESHAAATAVTQDEGPPPGVELCDGRGKEKTCAKGNFCNFDYGTSGFCESCTDFVTEEDCVKRDWTP
eukprot:CAMPEP_0170773912 /NCGR_PEP_ID=MMETSP0733-20121128/9653_1 /TAXON_ID=186038 /ORGANISM="Fragilariopsis kerguelensis, Strain L26-C5" /LENGTH=130 /DNA_ID=CAMNT_0011116385 /DNA_START=181 /DNA_END=574 /DNA_ORIENTATION=+